MSIQIEGVNNVVNQLRNYSLKVRELVLQQIILVGDKVVDDLKLKFKDLSITSQVFSEKLEYWIIITRLGKELTWIKCPVSSLSFTRKRDEFGKQEFKSGVPQLNIEEEIQKISEELSSQINGVLKKL
jgi:hypothetical protein